MNTWILGHLTSKLWSLLFWNEKDKKVQSHQHESVYLQIVDYNVIDYCFNNNTLYTNAHTHKHKGSKHCLCISTHCTVHFTKDCCMHSEIPSTLQINSHTPYHCCSYVTPLTATAYTVLLK